MDDKQTMEMNFRMLDHKQQNIFGRISLFWSMEMQAHPEQLNGDLNRQTMYGETTAEWTMDEQPARRLENIMLLPPIVTTYIKIAAVAY